jgi:hypothetical protein
MKEKSTEALVSGQRLGYVGGRVGVGQVGRYHRHRAIYKLC